MKNSKIRFGVALAALWVALAGWAISSPVGSSPDDDFHIGSIWCAGGYEVGLCQEIGNTDLVGEVSVLIPVAPNFCYLFDSVHSGKCFDGEPTSDLQKFRANDGLYPKLFYRVQHTFVGKDGFQSIYVMRLFNATVAVLVLGLALFLGRRELRIGLIAAWTFTLVPLGMFIIPSTNPSSWAYIGLATNWMFQMSAMRSIGQGDSRAVGNWIMYALTAAMCIGSRSDAATYIILSTIIVASIEFFISCKRKISSFVLPLVVCLISSLSILSTSQGKNFAEVANQRNASLFNRIIFNTLHFIEIPSGALGLGFGLGWLDTPLPTVVGILGISLFAITTYSALSIGERWRNLAAVTIIGFGYLVIMFVLTQGRFIIGEVVQPRYVLPLLPLFIGIASVQNTSFNASVERKTWRLIFILILTMTNAISIHTNIHRYVTGLDKTLALNLNSASEWWSQNYISPNLTFLITSISFSVFLYLIWNLLVGKKESEEFATSENVI